MRKFNLMLMLALTALFGYAQDAENASVVKKDDPLKAYLRPSLTVLYINRGEALSNRLIGQMVENGISGKFDDHSVKNHILTVPAGKVLSAGEIGSALEANVTKEIVKGWFPYDPSINGHSLRVVNERGMNTATDIDVQITNNAILREEILETAGLALIERSYIVVYDFYNIKKVSGENSNGYQTDCDVYLYQLDWNPGVKARFYAQWKNPKGVDEVDFPVKYVASFVKATQLTQVQLTQANSSSTPDNVLFQNFAKEIVKKADVYLTQANEDFKVKTEIFAVSPIRAKIGTKEGVTVDQRYFAYEIQLNDAGEKVTKRKGVIRATSKIAHNEHIATGEGPTTKFYQTYGKKLQEGMLLQQKPDWGISLSAFGGTDVSILAELSVSMWAGSLMKGASVPSGTKIYAKYALPFTTMEIDDEVKIIDEDTEKELNFGMFSMGLSKDIYFAHYFAITPYVGYSSLLVPKKYSESIKEIDKITYGVDAGVNLNIAILHNVQIIGNAGYNSAKAIWYSNTNGITMGAGLRIQF
jgi:hypothetical protein